MKLVCVAVLLVVTILSIEEGECYRRRSYHYHHHHHHYVYYSKYVAIRSRYRTLLNYISSMGRSVLSYGGRVSSIGRSMVTYSRRMSRYYGDEDTNEDLTDNFDDELRNLPEPEEDIDEAEQSQEESKQKLDTEILE